MECTVLVWHFCKPTHKRFISAYVVDVYCFAFIGDSDRKTHKMWTIIDLIFVLETVIVSFQNCT